MNKSPCQQNVNKKCQNTKLNGGEHPVVAYSVETNEFGIINEYGGIPKRDGNRASFEEFYEYSWQDYFL